jgi:hypothetical protein
MGLVGTVLIPNHLAIIPDLTDASRHGNILPLSEGYHG